MRKMFLAGEFLRQSTTLIPGVELCRPIQVIEQGHQEASGLKIQGAAPLSR